MKNKRLNKIVVSVLILLVTLSITPTSGTFSQRMFIPAYFYPGPDPGSLWNQATSGSPIVEIMVMNPASGPGTSQDQNYVNSVMNSFSAGIKVLGYVDTNYGY